MTTVAKLSRIFNRVLRVERYRQSIDSAGTSLNQLPAIFQKVKKSGGWKKGTINLDLGGGKYDQATLFLRRFGVTNIIIDPYNRPAEVNQQATAKLKQSPADTVTLANVLNVIPEPEEQLKVLAWRS